VGPANDKREESLNLSASFEEGVRHPVHFSFTLASPVGIVEVVNASNGAVLRSGATEYLLPPQGQKLTLRVRLDPNKRLPATGGMYDGNVVFFSKEAGNVTVQLHVPLQLPEFRLLGTPDVFSLWWEPHRPRVVHLGTLHTDASTTSTFSAVIPDALYDAGRQTKIADLTLRIGNSTAEPEPIENGKLRYQAVELPPGDGVPLDLIVTPDTKNGWDKLPSGQTPVPIHLLSSYGMETEVKPRFASIGPMHLPLLGVRSRHGRDLAAVWLLLFGITLLVLLFLGRLRSVRTFWPFRPGALQIVRSGMIEISDDASGAAALVLPNSGSPLDDTQVARVSADGRKQRVESLGPLVVQNPILAPGDTLVIEYPDPDDAANEPTTVWELQYIDYSGGEGEVEITTSPAPWTAGKLTRRTLLGAGILALLYALLGSGLAAKLAYSLPFIEHLYVH
jgi:hypothetical protein